MGLYPLIFLHSEYQPHHLLCTNCPASFPLLLAQWAHTSTFYATVGLYPHLLIQGAYISSFMTRWAYTPSFSYTVGTTLAIYCTHTVQPHFLSYLHSGPILLILCNSGPIPPIFLHSGHHPCHLLFTDSPASVPALLAQWAHTSSFYDTVGMYPLIYLHRVHHQSHLLYTNCPASFPLYLNSGPIPPHFMTQWAYTPSITYIVGTTVVI